MSLPKCFADALRLSLLFCAMVVFGGEGGNVITIAKAHPDGGGYNAAFTGSGSPETIEFKGARILSASTNGTFCNGFTFAVVMKAAGRSGLLTNKSVAEVRRFQQEWFGNTPPSTERQCALAVFNLGVGKEIRHEDARPGDFVQFWRKTKDKSSGHSAVFLRWVTNDGIRVGIEYRSSQGSTGGIGNAVEHFDGKGGHINSERIYFCRLN
jgi:hypothetical protein